MDSHFIILIDQKSLKFLTNHRLLTEEQFKWASKLIGFNFENRFRTSKDNPVVNTLSQRNYCMGSSKLQPQQWDAWEVESQVSLIQDLLVNPTSHASYELCKGRLFNRGKLVLPRGSSSLPTIFKEMHESPTRSHSRYFRTFSASPGSFTERE